MKKEKSIKIEYETYMKIKSLKKRCGMTIISIVKFAIDRYHENCKELPNV